MPTVTVLDSEMFYVAMPGKRTPLVFLHGNPTLLICGAMWFRGSGRCTAAWRTARRPT